jgi:hypothetical protein
VVGEAATELVNRVDADEDRELAPGVPPAFGQLASYGGKGARHENSRL